MREQHNSLLLILKHNPEHANFDDVLLGHCTSRPPLPPLAAAAASCTPPSPGHRSPLPHTGVVAAPAGCTPSGVGPRPPPAHMVASTTAGCITTSATTAPHGSDTASGGCTSYSIGPWPLLFAHRPAQDLSQRCQRRQQNEQLPPPPESVPQCFAAVGAMQLAIKLTSRWE